MHLILPATCPWGLNEGAVLAALLFKSKALPALGKRMRACALPSAQPWPITPLCQTSCRLRFSAGYPQRKRHFMHRKPHSHHSTEFKEQA
ncbi:hypothetical protein, partial [Polaromonas hydrogenivorans]|uniref:hypothetical protein n=1 Tax=Polaromonas hydrogenivorans TaxID=335476 RepID=UPI0039EE38B1